jgi:hypothetical protein
MIRDWIITVKMKLKKSMVCTIAKREVRRSSSPLPLIKLFGFLPKMMWNEGLKTANSLDVKKKRNNIPSGPDSFFDTEITFSSFINFCTTMVL